MDANVNILDLLNHIKQTIIGADETSIIEYEIIQNWYKIIGIRWIHPVTKQKIRTYDKATYKRYRR